MTQITIQPTAGALGAELLGIDLNHALTDDVFRQVEQALYQYQVIFFRDQNIGAAQQKSLADKFGPLQSHPAYPHVDGFPEVGVLESTPENPTKIEMWHTDMTFRPNPPLGTLLRATITPPKGGDTMWSSLSAAYDGLSSNMQNFLSDLTAEHDFANGFKESLAEPGGRERLRQALTDNPPVSHPVVRVHPVTQRKMLYVNPLFTTKINQLNSKESDGVLTFLYQHMITAEYTTRFTWRPNSIALWDNRATMHKPINDYFPAHRRMERITIEGELTL